MAKDYASEYKRLKNGLDKGEAFLKPPLCLYVIIAGTAFPLLPDGAGAAVVDYIYVFR